jgi:hypothetical protein
MNTVYLMNLFTKNSSVEKDDVCTVLQCTSTVTFFFFVRGDRKRKGGAVVSTPTATDDFNPAFSNLDWKYLG